MTCIIGMYYESGKGALVIADSRTMVGADYSRDQKVFSVGGGVVFAAAGHVGIGEKLLPRVQATRYSSRRYLPAEVVNIFEDEMAELYNRYKMTRPYRFPADEPLLTGIIGYLERDAPKLHCLFENGYAEGVRDFNAIGHGARHARNILRTLYDASLSKDRAIEIGVHALVEVSKVDAMVDSCPQVAVLEKDGGKDGLTILNYAGDNSFQYECTDISGIKEKLTGIEEKRTEVFHLLLDGSEDVKSKLDGVLKEYSRARQSAAKKKGRAKGDGGEGATAD